MKPKAQLDTIEAFLDKRTPKHLRQLVTLFSALEFGLSSLSLYQRTATFEAAKLSVEQMETFREDIAKMGYKFQFITLAGFHALNTSMFELALAYNRKGMAGYSELQQKEFALQSEGFRAVKHQNFVGTTYFDEVQNTVTAGLASTVAMKDSTETAQF